MISYEPYFLQPSFWERFCRFSVRFVLHSSRGSHLKMLNHIFLSGICFVLICTTILETLLRLYREKTKAPRVYAACPPNVGDALPPPSDPRCRSFPPHHAPPDVSYSSFSKSIRIQAESTNKSVLCSPCVQYRWIRDTSLSSKP